MFTGIITAQGNVLEAPKFGQVGRVTIKTTNDFLVKTKLGDSIAVNGVCLTVIDFCTDKNKCFFTVDISEETVNKTNFDNLVKDQLVNLEHSLCVGDSLDGHLVQGHVDTVVMVADILELDNNRKIILELNSFSDKNYMKYIAEKGSVTINGVSLTVNNIHANKFEVNLIPHTLKMTNLSSVKINDKLNLEIDMFARYCVNFLEQKNW